MEHSQPYVSPHIQISVTSDDSMVFTPQTLQEKKHNGHLSRDTVTSFVRQSRIFTSNTANMSSQLQPEDATTKSNTRHLAPRR